MLSLAPRLPQRTRTNVRLERHIPRLYVPGMILEWHPELRQLSPADKLALVTELWDDLAAHPEDVPVAPEIIAELDRRMEAYRKDPSQVTTWEAVKARLLDGTTDAA